MLNCILSFVSWTKKTPGKNRFKGLLKESLLLTNPAEFAPIMNIDFSVFDLRLFFDFLFPLFTDFFLDFFDFVSFDSGLESPPPCT